MPLRKILGGADVGERGDRSGRSTNPRGGRFDLGLAVYLCVVIHANLESFPRSLVCCCPRRDLRKLEDRLWARLHLLQEKENELHRQKTVILSRRLLPGAPRATHRVHAPS